ncbi:hypothetical protein MHYP_G00208070 [Metynnis hypsauchen]
MFSVMLLSLEAWRVTRQRACELGPVVPQLGTDTVNGISVRSRRAQRVLAPAARLHAKKVFFVAGER